MPLLIKDRALLDRFRRGEAQALSQVYGEYVAAVERIARVSLLKMSRWSGPGSPPRAADLKDVVQEVFMRAFSDAARASYDGCRPYRTYLAAITRNALVDWARRRGAEPMLAWEPLEESAKEAEEEAASQPPRAPVLDVVASFVALLPPDLRAVHESRFIRDLTQHEAAEALGISRQVLRTQERRLKDALRDYLRAVEREFSATGARPIVSAVS